MEGDKYFVSALYTDLGRELFGGKTDGMEGDKSGTGSVLSLDNELPDREQYGGKNDCMEGDKSGIGSLLSVDNELPDRESYGGKNDCIEGQESGSVSLDTELP